MDWVTAYPIATISSAAFYLLFLLLIVPRSRTVVAPLFGHPVKPHQRYLQGFDALRGFAALFVAVSHCWWASYPVFAATQHKVPWLAYGTKGVTVFAVLSGFLIYRSGLVGVESVPKLREYVVRRFFRIYPVYAACVVLSLATGQFVAKNGNFDFPAVLSDLFMLPVFRHRAYANPPAWSLYIEVMFYAALPLILVLVGRKRIVIVSILTVAVLTIADDLNRNYVLWRYFFFGMAASELSFKLRGHWTTACVIVGFGLVAYDFGGPTHDWAANLGIGLLHMDGQSLGLGLGCALFLLGLPHWPKLGAALDVLPLRVLGSISYSVYLVQFFYIAASFPEMGVFKAMNRTALYEHFRTVPPQQWWYLPFVFLPGLIAWSAVLFLLVERPGMKLGHWISVRARRTDGPAESLSSRP